MGTPAMGGSHTRLFLLPIATLLLAVPTTATTSADVLVALGGYGLLKSAEVWSPDGSMICSLPPLLEDMYAPSVDLVDGNITACADRKCWLLGKAAWEEGPATLKRRRSHTSAVLPGGGLLLVGGKYSLTTTEIVRPKHQSVAGFTLSPGRRNHCSVQTGKTSILLTGGQDTETMVQEYTGINQGTSATVKNMPSLNEGRVDHACGLYYVGYTKMQMAIVAGGNANQEFKRLDTTETINLSDPRAKWILRAGKLPSVRDGLKGVTLRNIFCISGGWDGSSHLDTVLAWNEARAEWGPVGTMANGRNDHGLAAVPSTALAGWCG